MPRWILRGSLLLGGPLLLAVAATLCSCAAFGVPTQNGYNQVLHTWIGQPPADLLARWGQPYKRYLNTDGTVILLYMRESDHIIDLQGGQPQLDVQNYLGAGAPALEIYEAVRREHEFQSVLTTNRCVTLFNVDRGGIIRKIEWIGDACRAVPQRGTGPDSWSASARQLVSPHALDTSSHS